MGKIPDLRIQSSMNKHKRTGGEVAGCVLARLWATEPAVGDTTGTKCGGDPYSPFASADAMGSTMVCGSEIAGVVQGRS